MKFNSWFLFFLVAFNAHAFDTLKIAECDGKAYENGSQYEKLELYIRLNQKNNPASMVGRFMNHYVLFNSKTDMYFSGEIEFIEKFKNTSTYFIGIRQNGKNKLDSFDRNRDVIKTWELWEVALDPTSTVHGKDYIGYVGMETNTPGIEGRNTEWSIPKCRFENLKIIDQHAKIRNP